jgi:hypothetical protein
MSINVPWPKSFESKATRAALVIAVLSVAAATFLTTPVIPRFKTGAVEFPGRTDLDVAQLTGQSRNLRNERFDTH